jgi:hypothetical protein
MRQWKKVKSDFEERVFHGVAHGAIRSSRWQLADLRIREGLRS